MSLNFATRPFEDIHTHRSPRSCVDTVTEYIRLAARGLVNASSTWYRCQCPKCFTPTATGGCEPKCDLATQCNEDFGCIIIPVGFRTCMAVQRICM